MCTKPQCFGMSTGSHGYSPPISLASTACSNAPCCHCLVNFVDIIVFVISIATHFCSCICVLYVIEFALPGVELAGPATVSPRSVLQSEQIRTPDDYWPLLYRSRHWGNTVAGPAYLLSSSTA